MILICLCELYTRDFDRLAYEEKTCVWLQECSPAYSAGTRWTWKFQWLSLHYSYLEARRDAGSSRDGQTFGERTGPRRDKLKEVWHSSSTNLSFIKLCLARGWQDKLKPYGFPVHGCIDGYSRKILWLKVCRTNNDPTVTGKHFSDTVTSIRVVQLYYEQIAALKTLSCLQGRHI